jgi:hypothetical protein
MLYFYYYPVPISKLYYNIKNNEKLDSLINETPASFLNSFLFKAQLGRKVASIYSQLEGWELV